MDPTGNSCPADGSDCALGPIDNCIAVESVDSGPEVAGPVFEVDTFIEALTYGESLLGYGYDIAFPMPIVDQIHTNAYINLTVQPGSQPVDISEVVPDYIPPHTVAISDMAYAEYNPPFTHGTLGRYTFDASGTEAGIHYLTFPPGMGTTPLVARDLPPGGSVFDPGGLHANGTDEDGDGAIDEDEVWDSNFSPQYGLIAVDVPCPAGPTVPTPVASATPEG